MVSNQFFVKKGPFPLKELIKTIDCVGDFSKVSNFDIYGVESLVNAKENDMTFLNSSKYKNLSLKTKAAACITTSNLSKFLPNNCIKLDVKNTLFAVTQVSRMFYPKADSDYPDANLLDSNELKKSSSLSVAFFSNILGAMLGGFLEYNSMYFGFRSLYIFAFIMYGCAFISSLYVWKSTSN